MVHRAEDPSDGSIVAIKILRTDRIGNHDVLRRFRKEARLMAEANNPYVVNLLEFNEDDGIPYMVLEFVAGESLGRPAGGTDPARRARRSAIMAAVARGLMEAHERGIVHRDIKPSNILLLGAAPARSPRRCRTSDSTPSETAELAATSDSRAATLALTSGRAIDAEPAAPRVKISDFGLARHVVDTESLALTAAGALLGTPHYMAPEQWTGRAVDPRTDVYAMGATLFHLLAGRPPFAAETRDDLAAQHCNEPPPRLATLNPSVSEGLARVVERALSKRPEDRYVDAGAMLRDMEALLHGKPTDLAIHPRLPDATRIGSSSSSFAGSWNHRPGSSGPWSPIPTGSTERSGLPPVTIQDPLRAGPRRADFRRRPQSRHGRGRRRASVRMDRAAADGGAARI